MVADEIEESEGGGVPYFLKDPFGVLRRRWVWMLVALLVGLACSTVFVMRLERIYAATATVLVTTQQIREDLVRSTVQEDSFQRLNALISSLTSSTTLGGLMDKFSLYPELREVLTRAEIIGQMREHIEIRAVSEVGKSAPQSARVFLITVENTQPDVAAEVANELASRFTDESIRVRTQQASLATNFLKAELKRAEGTLREQNAAIREFKERHRGELPGELEASLRKLERLQQQRQSLALQIAQAETRLALASAQAVIPLEGGALPASATAEQRLEAVRSELVLALAQYTEKHPEVLLLRRTIAGLEAELPEVSPTVAAAKVADTTVDNLREQLVSTELALAELDERVARTPARQESLTAFEERESVLRENYLDFLRKVQEAELALSLEAAQQGARFSVVERAEAPAKPTKTRMTYTIAAVLASIGLSLGIAVLLEALNPVLVSKAQIEAISGLPVLGSAPRLA